MDKVNPKIYRFGSRVSIPDGGGRRIPTVCARNRASGFTAGAATGRPLPLAWERRMPPLELAFQMREPAFDSMQGNPRVKALTGAMKLPLNPCYSFLRAMLAASL